MDMGIQDIYIRSPQFSVSNKNSTKTKRMKPAITTNTFKTLP